MTASQPAVPSRAAPRCLHCRVEVQVPASYTHGDQIKCGKCGTAHRVVRGEGVRLVLADVSALREAVTAADERVMRCEADLRHARGSMGIGVNGLGAGLAYVLWQIGFRDQPWSVGLLRTGLLLMLACGVALELANYFFLAKRQRMTRIAHELEAARADLRAAQQRLREAQRV